MTTCEQVIAALMRKKWTCSWCVKSSKDKISVHAAIISISPDVQIEEWRLLKQAISMLDIEGFFWPQWVQWNCNTLKRMLIHLLPISEMIDHLVCWRRALGKERKCEILKHLEYTAGKNRDQFIPLQQVVN